MKKMLYMKIHLWVTALVIISVFMGCSTTYNAVSFDYDRSVDFTKYKTFAWLPDRGDTASTPYNNEIIRNNIRNYFGQCMSDRGYTVDLENPDILMQLFITNARKERIVTYYPSTYYYRPYYYGSFYYNPYPFTYYYRYYPSYVNNGYWSDYSSTQKTEYVKGAITLNFIDKRSNKLIWTGTAEGDIYDPSMIGRDLHPAVHKILNEYPVLPLVKRSHKIK